MGKFICLYGINNLGKSTQANLLVAHLRERGLKAEYLKYPIYTLEPTGPLLYKILRDKNVKIGDPTAKQLIYTANRFQFAGKLDELLSKNDFVIAEDYIGTGLAWGAAEGVDLGYLEQINSILRKPDLEILVDGERFTEAVESGHIHETNSDLTEKCRQIHLDLAQKYGWPIVNANQSIDAVYAEIFSHIKKFIK